MGRVIATFLVILCAGAVGACGGSKTPATTAVSATGASSATTTSDSATTSTSSSTVTVAPADAGACALLLARVQRVTTALSTASELIAHSVNKQQLSQRIAIEKVQLQRSAQLMAGGPIPASLQAPDRQLVLGLDAFADDFARAEKPAQRGDFRAAVQAMGDATTVQGILAATKTIENACQGA